MQGAAAHRDNDTLCLPSPEKRVLCCSISTGPRLREIMWRLNCTSKVSGMVPGAIPCSVVRGDEFLSIHRICPSYSQRPIPSFPLPFPHELPEPWILFPLLWVTQGDVSGVSWGPWCHQQDSDETETLKLNTDFLVTQVTQSTKSCCSRALKDSLFLSLSQARLCPRKFPGFWR